MQWESLFKMHLTKSATHGPRRLHQSKGLPNMWSSLGNESVAAALSFLSLRLNKKHDHDRLIYCLGSGPPRWGAALATLLTLSLYPDPVSVWAGPQAVAPHLRLDDESIFLNRDKVCHDNGDKIFDVPFNSINNWLFQPLSPYKKSSKQCKEITSTNTYWLLKIWCI